MTAMQTLPADARQAMSWTWAEFEPHYQQLAETDLTQETFPKWLSDWTALSETLSEISSRLYVATSVDTEDSAAEDALMTFVRSIEEQTQGWEQKLKEKLLASGLTLPGLEYPLQQAKLSAEIFREGNIPRFTALIELGNEFDKMCGAQTVEWEGKEVSLSALKLPAQSEDRAVREKAFRAKHSRILADRASYNELWAKAYDIRLEVAKEAGFSSYTDYQYKAMGRLDYSQKDCDSFRAAIAEKVVPAAERIMKRRAEKLGYEVLKPWDESVDAYSSTPLRPFATEQEFMDKAKAIFAKVDPQCDAWYRRMVDEGLMDLMGRKGKANGGYCTAFPRAKTPFIFMNGVGTHDDIQTLLHEAGHCFHAFECFELPYGLMKNPGLEFCEVASMGMEMLCQPYLDAYYSPAEAARAQIQHLEKCLLFWPYMAVVDGFQHWAYSTPEGRDAAACDKAWTDLWRTYMKGTDWSDEPEIEMTGWHRKLHIFQIPFYYVEYGMAQVGAFQVWLNSRKDPAEAARLYRAGLALGSTQGLPGLFAAVGGKFQFDSSTLGELVDAAEERVEELLQQV